MTPDAVLSVELWRAEDGAWCWQVRDRWSTPLETGTARLRRHAEAALLDAVGDQLERETDRDSAPA